VVHVPPKKATPEGVRCVSKKSKNSFVPKNITKVRELNPHMQIIVCYVGYGSRSSNTLNDLNHKQLSHITFISLEV